MRYNQYGRTGLLVSELALGAMTFGGVGFWQVIGKVDQAGVDAIVSRALEAGVNFFDTANVYSNGEAERLLGAALGSRRHDAVIATKVSGKTGTGPNDSGLSRGHIIRAADESLRRLGTDYIDIYQIHGFDRHTRLEETLQTLDDLVRCGKVRYVACSNLAAWQIMKATGIAECHGWARFESVQAYYSLAARDIEREIVPLLEDQRLGLIVWGALASGLLGGKYSRDNQHPAGSRRALFDFPPVERDRAFDTIDVLAEVAAAHGVSQAKVAIAWLLRRPAVTSVIMGVTGSAQLEDNLSAADLDLHEAEIVALNEVSALTPEYPGWMLNRSDGRAPSTARTVAPVAAAPVPVPAR